MARAIWSGAIGFGLVNVPVRLYNAVSRREIRFNELERGTGARLSRKRVSSVSGEEVAQEDVVRGFEVAKDRYVIVDDDELDAIRPATSRTIAIEQFVGLPEVDPVLFDTAYYAAPERGGARAYALLVAALEESGRCGVGRFMLRSRESLACVRADGGHLVVHRLVWGDEVVPAATIPEISELEPVDPSEKERQMARLLVDSMSEPLQLGRERDTYRDAVLALVERKAAGEVVESAPPAERGAPVVDIMAALEASLAAARERRGDEAEEPAAAAPKPRARRRTTSS